MPSFLGNLEASAVSLPSQIDFLEEASADEAEVDTLAELDVHDVVTDQLEIQEQACDPRPSPPETSLPEVKGDVTATMRLCF